MLIYNFQLNAQFCVSFSDSLDKPIGLYDSANLTQIPNLLREFISSLIIRSAIG